jgi:glyoxylase I family protein
MSDVRFAHVGITCKDPIAMEQFYSKYFRFKRIRVIPLGDDQIVFTQSGNLVLEIFKAREDRPVPQADKDGPAYPALKHLAFEVPDVEAKLAEMGDDAKINLGPMKFDDFIPGWAAVWISDPEGNVIEITQGFQKEENPPDLP